MHATLSLQARDYLQRVYTILGNQKAELERKGMKVLEHATEILDTHFEFKFWFEFCTFISFKFCFFLSSWL